MANTKGDVYLSSAQSNAYVFYGTANATRGQTACDEFYGNAALTPLGNWSSWTEGGYDTDSMVVLTHDCDGQLSEPQTRDHGARGRGARDAPWAAAEANGGTAADAPGLNFCLGAALSARLREGLGIEPISSATCDSAGGGEEASRGPFRAPTCPRRWGRACARDLGTAPFASGRTRGCLLRSRSPSPERTLDLGAGAAAVIELPRPASKRAYQHPPNYMAACRCRFCPPLTASARTCAPADHTTGLISSACYPASPALS